MTTASSIFKFVTVRHATSGLRNEIQPAIQPTTALSKNLVGILSSELRQPEKIKAVNEVLSAFIKSDNFYKTKEGLSAAIQKLSPAESNDQKDSKNNIEIFYENLYDNIVNRVITKSNTNEVFKLLTDTIRSVYQKLNPEKVRFKNLQSIQIMLPEGLILSFKPPKKEDATKTDEGKIENAQVILEINNIEKQKKQIAFLKEENQARIRLEEQKIIEQQNDIIKARAPVENDEVSMLQKQIPSVKEALMLDVSRMALNKLLEAAEALDHTERDLNSKLADLNKKAFNFIPCARYAYVGEKYINVASMHSRESIVQEDKLIVYSNGCELKFPFQIADLRVIEQLTVGYLPNEIAHINNTQSHEKQKKVTRRLKRVETFDSLITEDEVTRETDTQSTEKFSLEKAASDVQSEETSINVNTSASGTYGVVTASVDAGVSHSESSTNSNSASQGYAKEIVQKVVDRVSHKVRSERSLKSIEEFEEIVTHIIDNQSGAQPKSYVYRWLTKLVKATLRNYGKRLMFEIKVAHPSHYYLTRAITEKATINIPPDPRKLNANSCDDAIRDFYAQNPGFPVSFSIENINPQNFSLWVQLYKVKMDAPPNDVELVVWEEAYLGDGVKSFKSSIQLPKGYFAKSAQMSFQGASGWLFPTIGIKIFRIWHNDSTVRTGYFTLLNGESGYIPFTLIAYSQGNAQSVNIEIRCEIEPATIRAWQTKCYFAIIEAYENMKAEAEAKMSEFNPNNPGLNPNRKTDLIKTELKKGALLKMFRCNPFWVTDNYVAGQGYNADCCADNLNAEQVRFLETVFDWRNMTYELYPYFHADKDNWKSLLDLTDDDPHFESFLQASYATLRIPVYRDAQKELAAINFVLNNSISNYSTVPAGVQPILDDLKANTPFEYIDENATKPFIAIKKEYDRTGNPKIFYTTTDPVTNTKIEVLCTEVQEFDKEGNQTKFYYDSAGQMVVSEIKTGINGSGQQYNYYFDSDNNKVITHHAKTEYLIDGSSQQFYSVDLGIFHVPTDLVILEKGVEDGVELVGYDQDNSAPSSDVVIPQQFSPAIIRKTS